MPAMQQGAAAQVPEEGEHLAFIAEWRYRGKGEKFGNVQGAFILLLLDDLIDDPDNKRNGQPKECWANHNMGAGRPNRKTKVRKWLEAIRGAEYTVDDIKNGKCDPELAVGQFLSVYIDHTETDASGAPTKYSASKLKKWKKEIPEQWHFLAKLEKESAPCGWPKQTKEGGGTWIVWEHYKNVEARKQQDTSFDPAQFGGDENGKEDEDDSPSVSGAAVDAPSF